MTLIRHGAGDRSKLAAVRYASIWGTRAHKLAALGDLAAGRTTLPTYEASADWHAPLIPTAGGADWAACPKVTDLFPWQQPGSMVSRTWPVAPTPSLLEERWELSVSTRVPDERLKYFAPSKTGRSITTRVPGYRRLVDLEPGAAHERIVRFGMRSFDRQWTFQDPRLANTESPSLWASLSSKQVFLTTMTTTSLGGGPAATLTTAVPDKHYFCGRGGKDVVPLFRDAKGTPNVDPAALKILSDKLGIKVTVEQLFAYAFGVLAGTDYTERFHEALETPGPRVPLTADPDLFAQMTEHGLRLVWLQTFGERFGAGTLPTIGITWKAEPSRLPETKADINHEAVSETLQIADGVLTGVPADVWNFEVSGMTIIAKRLGYRMSEPAGRAASSDSPLDHIRPTTWSPEWSIELIEIVAVIRDTLALVPDGVALLDDIIAGPLIAADELPAVPAALRKPPSGKAREDLDALTFDDGMLPGTNVGGLF